MYNIGLTIIKDPVKDIPIANILSIFNDISKHVDTVVDLIHIRQSLVKYGKTNQLLELVQPTLEGLNATCSVEGIGSAIMSVLRWIKDKIVKLVLFIKEIIITIGRNIRSTVTSIYAKLRNIPDPNTPISFTTAIVSKEFLDKVVGQSKRLVSVLEEILNRLGPTVTKEDLEKLYYNTTDNLTKADDELGESIRNIKLNEGGEYIHNTKPVKILADLNIKVEYCNVYAGVVHDILERTEKLLRGLKNKVSQIENTMGQIRSDEDLQRERAIEYNLDTTKRYLSYFSRAIEYNVLIYRRIQSDLVNMLNFITKYNTNTLPKSIVVRENQI